MSYDGKRPEKIDLKLIKKKPPHTHTHKCIKIKKKEKSEHV